MPDSRSDEQPTTLSAHPLSTPTLAPKVPDHELLRCIGTGSFGEVWLARNLMGTYRAVKFIRRQSFSNERPYNREFHGLQKFEPVSRSHDGFVDILQAGRNDAEGYFFYVMELGDDLASGAAIDAATYEAKTLQKEAAKRCRIPVSECITLGVSLAAALAHLHKHGLMHRDIKPSNIIFVNGIPKLADIGLVSGVQSLVSFPGGTLGFIPPEGPGTAQADIYGLGKVLYEISTGHDRQDFPELPTELEGIEQDEDFLELNEVILKACERNPKARYQTADQLHADLLLLQSGESIKRLRLLERRVALLTRIGAVGAVLLVLGAGTAYVANRQIRLDAELKRQRVYRNVAQGTQFLEKRDYFRSLPPLVEAFNLERRNAAREETHRTRIAAVLGDCPRIVQMWFVQGDINGADFSQDGRRMIAAGVNGDVTLCENGNPFGSSIWFHITNEVECASFSPDGKLAVVGGKKFAQVWELGATRPLRSVKPPATVYSARFSPDGRQFVTASGRDNEGHVWIFDVSPSGGGTEFLQATTAYRSASFSPDGKRLLTAGEDFTAEVWDLATHARVGKPIRHADWVYHATFSPTGDRVITASLDEKVQVCEADTGRVIVSLDQSAGAACAEFSPDGRYVVAACRDHAVRIWDTFTGQLLYPTLTHSGKHVVYAGFSPNGRQVLTANANGVICLWDLAPLGAVPAPGRFLSDASGNRLLSFQTNGVVLLAARVRGPSVSLENQLPVRDAVFNRDGKWLVTFSESLLTRNTGTVARLCSGLGEHSAYPQFALNEANVTNAALSDDGQYLAGCTGTNAIVWHAPTGRRVYSLGHAQPVEACSFSPQGDFLVTRSGRHACLWDAVRGKKAGVFPHPDLVSHAVFSPNGRLLATSCNSEGTLLERAAYIWDVATRQAVGRPLPHGDGVSFIAFSPDGKRVVTASEDETARVWEVGSSKGLIPPLHHHGQVTEACFTPDGRWIITASQTEQTARVWDAETGDPITPPLRHPRQFIHAQFLPERRAILTRRSKGESFIWQLPRDPHPLDDLLRMAQLLSGHQRDETGAVLPLPAAAVRELWQSLRSRYPADFQVTEREILDWHLRQAEECERAESWEAADFHWDQLTQLNPGDPALSKRPAKARRPQP